MRVIHIIKVIRVAGAEQHLLTLLAGLRARGIDARMILLVEPCNDMANYVASLTERNIPVQRLVIRRHLDITLFGRLRAELIALKPDIVHSHLIHGDVYGIPSALMAGVPVVISSRHNDDAFRHRLLVRLVTRLLWRMMNAAIAISDSIKRFTIEVEGAPPAKMQRIYYGLDTRIKPLDRKPARSALIQELNLSDENIFIGMVCRLVEQKGVLYGLEAFHKVAAEFPTAHLLIAGEGSLRPALEGYVTSADLKSRVHFLGWRSDAPALLAALDILLAPSLWEGFGLVMLEAMAQQVPIIGSAVSATPEVVCDTETGLLVPPRDVDALAEALHQLLKDKPLRQHMGLLGRDRLETHFSAAKMVEETSGLYHTLLDGL